MIAYDCKAIIQKEDKSMAKGTITIRTQPELEEKITALAKTMDRSRNWVIEEALKRYVETEEWQIEGIRKAQSSLERGESVPFEEIMSSLQTKINDVMKKQR